MVPAVLAVAAPAAALTSAGIKKSILLHLLSLHYLHPPLFFQCGIFLFILSLIAAVVLLVSAPSHVKIIVVYRHKTCYPIHLASSPFFTLLISIAFSLMRHLSFLFYYRWLLPLFCWFWFPRAAHAPAAAPTTAAVVILPVLATTPVTSAGIKKNILLHLLSLHYLYPPLFL